MTAPQGRDNRPADTGRSPGPTLRRQAHSYPVASNITSVLKETRIFPPPAEFAARPTSRAWRSTKRSSQRAEADPEGFWAEQAEVAELVQAVGQGARVERAARQVVRRRQAQRQRQLPRPAPATGRGATRPAIIWEGEPGDSRVLTYQDAAPRSLQVRQRPEGAGHQAGRPRHHLHADGPGSWRSRCWPAPASGRRTPSSSAASARKPSPTATTTPRPSSSSPPTAAGGAARSCRSRRTSMTPWRNRRPSRSASSSTAAISRSTMKPGRDLWWHELMADASADCPPEPLDSEHPLFILYTSGSTGKPKGVLHTTAGYLLGVSLHAQVVFDLKEEDVYWCTADIGWVTGHSYIVYGPLANGATTVMYEGAPNQPREGPLLGDHREVQGQRSSTPRRRRSARSSSGATSGRTSTTCRACACSAASASRSTPKRGCGITR